MTEPRVQLGELLGELAAAAELDVNVADAPTSGAAFAAPALIVRPDNPWRQPQAPTKAMPFAHIAEGYAVVAVVHAGDPASSVDQLRAMVRLVEDAQDGGPWRWIETTGIVQITEGGIDYLGSTVRMQYLEG
jgi:hypothetical protein